MRKIKTKGICSYCKTEVVKNSRSIMNHIINCGKSIIHKNDNITPHMILLIEGKYNPAYWLVIKAKSDITMKKIDKFLRDIWLECCGHLSAFSNSYSRIGMTRKLADVFEKGYKIDYIYDFGSSTEITLSVLDEIEDKDEKDIQILMRNKEIDYKCSYCNNKAIAICPFCIYEDEGLLCESCIEKHKCVQNEGEHVLLPLVNSPRFGECGYCGYEDKDVIKYFPKGII